MHGALYAGVLEFATLVAVVVSGPSLVGGRTLEDEVQQGKVNHIPRHPASVRLIIVVSSVRGFVGNMGD